MLALTLDTSNQSKLQALLSSRATGLSGQIHGRLLGADDDSVIFGTVFALAAAYRHPLCWALPSRLSSPLLLLAPSSSLG